MSEESLENLVGGENKISAGGFFNYVFNLDSDNKGVILNMIQYICIAIIPLF